jgi:hypothetical protein
MARLSGNPVDSRVSTICRERVSSSRCSSSRRSSLGEKGVSAEEGSFTRPSGCVIDDWMIATDTSRRASSDMALEGFVDAAHGSSNRWFGLFSLFPGIRNRVFNVLVSGVITKYVGLPNCQKKGDSLPRFAAKKLRIGI